MTSLKFKKIKNYWSSWDFTFMMCKSSWKLVFILYLHNTIIHLFNPPKICIGIVLDFSEDIFMSQEKLQTMTMQNFGGLKRCILGFAQVENTNVCSARVLAILINYAWISRLLRDVALIYWARFPAVLGVRLLIFLPTGLDYWSVALVRDITSTFYANCYAGRQRREK